MSGHVHPDELTELERHRYKLCSSTVCAYCADDEAARIRSERFKYLELARKELVEALEECAQDLLNASQYKGEYLQKKHRDVEEVERYRALVAKYKETA